MSPDPQGRPLWQTQGDIANCIRLSYFDVVTEESKLGYRPNLAPNNGHSL